MQNFVVLIFAVSTCMFAEISAQILCADQIQIGELRVLNSRRCVNIVGTDGYGDVGTYYCDGYDDQQFILCGDGTIRNLAAPQNCLTPSGTDGEGDVSSTVCKQQYGIPNYQKWKVVKQESFKDSHGIYQVPMTFRNMKSGECLDVSGHSGKGNIKTYPCHGRPDQSFYFRSRGGLRTFGRLQNEKSDLCLDYSSKYLKLRDCSNAKTQYFYYYENGEILNNNRRLCLDVGTKSGTGSLRFDDCADRSYQVWSRLRHQCNGDYCAFVNEKSQYCTNTEGYSAKRGSTVGVYKCDGASDQRYRWVTEKWEAANAQWTQVGCVEGGVLEHSISNTVTASKSETKEFSSTIEASTTFYGVTLSTSVTNSLATSWENTRSGTKSLTFKCTNYPASGKPFAGGCMWRLVIDAKKKTDHSVSLEWKSLIVKCTSNKEAPKCPPFTKCKDDACTKCVDSSGGRKKKA